MKATLFSYLTTLIVVALAGWAAVSLYLRYMQHPWTRDGQVRANIVGIAPRVSGPIIHVAVHDNQELRKGGLLFEIDPSDFQAQVDIAAGQVQNGKKTRRMPPKVNSSWTASPLLSTDGQSVSMSVRPGRRIG